MITATLARCCTARRDRNQYWAGRRIGQVIDTVRQHRRQRQDERPATTLLEREQGCTHRPAVLGSRHHPQAVRQFSPDDVHRRTALDAPHGPGPAATHAGHRQNQVDQVGQRSHLAMVGMIGSLDTLATGSVDDVQGCGWCYGWAYTGLVPGVVPELSNDAQLLERCTHSVPSTATIANWPGVDVTVCGPAGRPSTLS